MYKILVACSATSRLPPASSSIPSPCHLVLSAAPPNFVYSAALISKRRDVHDRSSPVSIESTLSDHRLVAAACILEPVTRVKPPHLAIRYTHDANRRFVNLTNDWSASPSSNCGFPLFAQLEASRTRNAHGIRDRDKLIFIFHGTALGGDKQDCVGNKELSLARIGLKIDSSLRLTDKRQSFTRRLSKARTST